MTGPRGTYEGSSLVEIWRAEVWVAVVVDILRTGRAGSCRVFLVNKGRILLRSDAPCYSSIVKAREDPGTWKPEEYLQDKTYYIACLCRRL
jgi:hypothetical protein